ncbi:MAG: tRNA preQ1(34) S-adenosylmethionine ribosyltransferase-isomerase QueA [Clostridia bacterium]|nr:tRNA preQ1(34) S-adenosylmethionine ribosyltransferase-isomerase QueA [Clostridia bacterium]
MKRSDFFYDLPEELIAQTPVEPRDSSRLLVMDRDTGEIEHRIFRDVTEYFEPGDCLILNDTKVLPARLYAQREDTGATVEFLLLNQKSADTWEVLAGPGKKAKEGHRFLLGNGLMKAEVTEVLDDGNRLVRFEFDGNFFNIIDKIGEMPLPHYIRQRLEDKERYQTVYAKENGSAAAPTAGLHFTPELLERIRAKGVRIGYVTLHVGLGTFRPVKAENIENHHMHSEHYCLPVETAVIINETKANGGRVFAVGTTCIRTLESVAKSEGEIRAAEGWTDIFIYPGFEFRCADCLITNFHLPESTLIMLVSAFCGYENTMNAYKIAVDNRYRFFSFGDAMLITQKRPGITG